MEQDKFIEQYLNFRKSEEKGQTCYILCETCEKGYSVLQDDAPNNKWCPFCGKEYGAGGKEYGAEHIRSGEEKKKEDSSPFCVDGEDPY